MTAHIHIALFVALWVAVSLPGSRAQCELQTTCADCVCNTFDYTTEETCNTGSCAWLDGMCVSASTTNTAAIKVLYDVDYSSNGNGDDRTSYYNRQVSDGNVQCPISRGGGTIFSVVFLLSLAGLSSLLMAYYACRAGGGKFGRAQWLDQLVDQKLPAGEEVLWRGESQSNVTKATYFWVGFILALPLSIPSIVWLGIGIPSEIEADWGFAFFYPIWLVGGFGILGTVAAHAAMCSGSDTYICGYALTRTHAVLYRASTHSRDKSKLGFSIKVKLDSVVHVSSMAGHTVWFKTKSVGQETVERGTVTRGPPQGSPVKTDGAGTVVCFANIRTGNVQALMHALAGLAPGYAAGAVPAPTTMLGGAGVGVGAGAVAVPVQAPADAPAQPAQAITFDGKTVML